MAAGGEGDFLGRPIFGGLNPTRSVSGIIHTGPRTVSISCAFLNRPRRHHRRTVIGLTPNRFAACVVESSFAIRAPYFTIILPVKKKFIASVLFLPLSLSCAIYFLPAGGKKNDEGKTDMTTKLDELKRDLF